MKLSVVTFVSLLGLSACTTHSGPTANCFDQDVVTRAPNSLSLLAVGSDTPFKSPRSNSQCTFVALGDPTSSEAE